MERSASLFCRAALNREALDSERPDLPSCSPWILSGSGLMVTLGRQQCMRQQCMYVVLISGSADSAKGLKMDDMLKNVPYIPLLRAVCTL